MRRRNASRRPQKRTRNCRCLPTRQECRDPGASDGCGAARRCPRLGASFWLSPCHRSENPNRAAPTTRAAPKTAAALPRGCPARRRFRRETHVPKGQIEAVFEAKFRACPPASPPPSFGLVRSAAGGPPRISRAGAPANDRTRNGPRPEPPAQARVPTTDLTGRSGLRSKEHRLFDHCRSLPAMRRARDCRAQRAGDENRSSAPTTTAVPYAGAAMERVQRNCRRATPYYESPHYGSRTYKIVSEIDFSFGRDGGHRRS